MTSALPPQPSARTTIREVLGLICLVLGAAGMVATAALVHPLAGAGVLSVLVLAAGVFLSSSEV